MALSKEEWMALTYQSRLAYCIHWVGASEPCTEDCRLDAPEWSTHLHGIGSL